MATRDIWLVGAPILQDLRECFTSLLKLHEEERERQYAFDFYDFHIFHDETATNILSQITNSVASGLTKMRRLPTLMFIFLEDLIFTSAEIYLASEVESQLRWIFKTIDNFIKQRKSEMPQKALRQAEPQVYIIRSFPRFNFGRMKLHYDEFVYRQEKYNTLLEQIARCYGFGTVQIYSIDPKDRLCFNDAGTGRQLSHRGMFHFWRELLQAISYIDREKDEDNRKRILDEENRKRDKHPFHYNNHYKRY